MKTHLMAMASAVALLAGWAAHAQSSAPPLGTDASGTPGSAPPAAVGLPTAGPDSGTALGTVNGTGTGMNPTTGGISDPAATGSTHSGTLTGPADTGTALKPHGSSTGMASGDDAATGTDRMGGTAMGAAPGQGDTAAIAGHLASNDRASLEQLIGRRVADTSGEQLGRIGDVILDTKTGQAQQAVIAMEQGGRNVAVEFTDLHVPQDGKADIVLSTMNKEQLAAMGAFSYGDSMVSLGGHGSGPAAGMPSAMPGDMPSGSAADGTAGSSSLGSGSLGTGSTGTGTSDTGSRQLESGTPGTGTTAPTGSGSSRPEGSTGGMPTRP